MDPSSQEIETRITGTHVADANWWSLPVHSKFLRNGDQIIKKRITAKDFNQSVNNPIRKILLKEELSKKKWDGLKVYSFAIRPGHPLYVDTCMENGAKMGSWKNHTQSWMIKCFESLPIDGMYLETWQYNFENHTIRFLSEKLIKT